MVKQKSSLESAMTVEAARDSKEPTPQLKNLIHQEKFDSRSISSIPMKTKVMGHFFGQILSLWQSYGINEDDLSSQLLEYHQSVIQQSIHSDLAQESLRQNR